MAMNNWFVACSMSLTYGTLVGIVRGFNPWMLRILKELSVIPASGRAVPVVPVSAELLELEWPVPVSELRSEVVAPAMFVKDWSFAAFSFLLSGSWEVFVEELLASGLAAPLCPSSCPEEPLKKNSAHGIVRLQASDLFHLLELYWD